MSSIPTVPEDVAGLADDKLQALHEHLGAFREELRVEHRRVVDELHARETAAAEAARTTEPAAGGSITMTEGS